jgi:hypothetical protein
MNALSIIPSHDTHEFSLLTTEQRSEVKMWSLIVQEIDAAKSRSACMKAIAARYADSRSMSATNIKTKYYAWKKDGWKELINCSKLKSSQKVKVLGDAPKGLSPVTIDYWKMLQESYQRSSEAARRELIRRYREGEDIPGIGTWRTVFVEKFGTRPPEKYPTDVKELLPEGFSKRNLQRYRPSKVELAAARQGRGAAAAFRPLVNTTRVGGAPGKMYILDDVWHDFLVSFEGQQKAMRPLEFCCVDYFSGCQFAWGMQPMIEDLETGKRKTLEVKENLFLLTHILCNVGFHPDGCQIKMEHGSATAPKEICEFLHEKTNGLLTFGMGGIDQRATHDGYFMARPRGNSRFKAALESHHNLKHNELAMLPGQIGKDRDHCPEQMFGLEKYNGDLLKVALQYPELADLFVYPTLEFHQARMAVTKIYEAINFRTDHDLEGWQEAGLMLNRFQLIEGGDEIPMSRLLAMPSAQREAVKAAMIPLPPRRMAPAEVFYPAAKNFTRLPWHCAPMILGEQNAEIKRLGDDCLFNFENMRIGPGKHRYLGRAYTEAGDIVQLDQGKEYMLWLSPFCPDLVCVADIRGSFLGVCKVWDKPYAGDLDAVHRKIGKAESIAEDLFAPVKRRHTQEAKERREMIDHNNRVMVQAGLRPEKKNRKPQRAAIPQSGVDLISMYDDKN